MLLNVFVSTFINFPDINEARVLAKENIDYGGIPGAILQVDGCEIPWVAPAHTLAFMNYKYFENDPHGILNGSGLQIVDLEAMKQSHFKDYQVTNLTRLYTMVPSSYKGHRERCVYKEGVHCTN